MTKNTSKNTLKPYYITTAISYPNGLPHIGHAYEMIATDALARFKRAAGYDVFFLTGTDEHGIKMTQTAQAQNINVQHLADQNSAQFKALARALNLSHNRFIRTTEPEHHKACQTIWNKMVATGDVYLDMYAGWYSVRDEAYYDESELSDGEGGKLSPQGTPVTWVEEESYFFRLSAYEEKLLAHFNAHPNFIGPKERRNEIISFVRSGLRDLSISRTTFNWGVPVPNAPEHVMYVWVDALTNYITGIGYPDEEASNFKRYWPANAHIIGKDILRFHAVYWPAFLMSAGVPLPQRVYAHGFLTVNGKKMSKSEGNVIDPFELIEQFGVDPVRYFFLSDIRFGSDGDYSHQKLVARNNADLANDLGNLAQRCLSMIAKNCDCKVPTPALLRDEDTTLLDQALKAIDTAKDAMDRQHIHDAISALFATVSDANKYFAAQKPWVLRKTDAERMNTVLYVTIETLRRLSLAIQAFLPESGAKLLDALGIADHQRLIPYAYDEAAQLITGSDLPTPRPIFKRLEIGD